MAVYRIARNGYISRVELLDDDAFDAFLTELAGRTRTEAELGHCQGRGYETRQPKPEYL